MKIFTIRDRVSQKAGNIFTCANIGEAERQFKDALANSVEGSLFRSHPQDFDLYYLGDFDADTVQISNPQSTIVSEGSKASASRYDELISRHHSPEVTGA